MWKHLLFIPELYIRKYGGDVNVGSTYLTKCVSQFHIVKNLKNKHIGTYRMMQFKLDGQIADFARR